MSDVLVSVVIPARNEAENIGKCIASLLKNSDVPHEIIVIDNGSRDATASIATDMGVTVLINPTGTISALRNMGARRARGELLVFLDADMVVPEGFLKKGKDYFDRGFTGALGFDTTVPSDAGWVARVWGQDLRFKDKKEINVDFLISRCIFIKKSTFEETGGFDELLKTNEDKDFTMRVAKVGYPLVYSNKLRLIHLGYEKDLFELIRKEFWRQGSTLMFARRWHFAPRTLRNPMLSLWHIWALLLFMASILYGVKVYAITTLILWILPSALIVLKKPDFNVKVMLPLFILTFIRWNVAGISLIAQVVRLATFRRHYV